MIFYKCDNDSYPYPCHWCGKSGEGYVLTRESSWNTCVPCLIEHAPMIQLSEVVLG